MNKTALIIAVVVFIVVLIIGIFVVKPMIENNSTNNNDSGDLQTDLSELNQNDADLDVDDVPEVIEVN